MSLLKQILDYLQKHPQPLKTPASSLQLARFAPAFLQSSDSHKDTQETWLVYEQLLIACLRVEDDVSASKLLHTLEQRFGPQRSRIQALKGLYDEAQATDDRELVEVLRWYEKLLQEDPTNLAIEKRRIALLTSLNRRTDAIAALVNLLSHSPTDVEAWAQLAELYRQQGLYQQSIYSLEEVILITPNAYNIFARLGEIYYIASPNDPEQLADAVRHFCRAVELCEWYLRGWYGLRLVTGRILKEGQGMKGKDGLDRAKAERLYHVSGERLKTIVRRAKKGDNGWTGFDKGEVLAAEELMKEEEAS